MATYKKVVGTGKKLLSRVAGFSFMGVGVSWKAPEAERSVVRAIVTQLEDRRALYTNEEREGPTFVVQSILKIREILTEGLQRLDEKSPAVDAFRTMRAACRDFLSHQAMQEEGHFRDTRQTASFYAELGKLRGVFGQHLAVLCVMYELSVEEGLASIFPPKP